MSRSRNTPLLLAAGLLIAASAPITAQTGVSVTTYHNDNARSGFNPNETVLTPSNVTAGSFGVLTTVALDDYIDTQPLVVNDATIQTFAPNGVVYVGSNSNMLYAIDAVNGTILVKRSLGTPVPTFGGCTGPYTGILSTPTIDLASRTLFVMSYKLIGGNATYQLHALDLQTLADKTNSPVTVTASQALEDGSNYAFNAKVERQRPAMLEANGSVYVAWGSFCDTSPSLSRGWVLAWDATTLAPLTHPEVTDRQPPTFSTGICSGNVPAPCFLNAIWMSGYGLSADAFGNIYFVTGNSAIASYDSTYNLAESAIKMSPDLSETLSFFTPNNQVTLDTDDTDFGAGGMLLLPDQPGQFPHLGVAAGKDGRYFLLNRDSMGGFNIPDIPSNVSAGGCWCGPSYYQTDAGTQVVTSGGTSVQTWTPTVVNNVPTLSKVATAPTMERPHGLSSFFTSISSNGTDASTSIIWAVNRAAGTDNHITLYAYAGAPNGTTLPLLWSGIAGYWAVPSNHNSNLVPTIANGHVYVASYAQLTILGELTPGTTATAATTSIATINPNVPATVTATVTAQSGTATPTGTISFSAGATTLGTATLSGSGTSATASLSVNSPSLPAGSSTVDATYLPTGNFSTSSGPVYIFNQVPSSLFYTAAPFNTSAGTVMTKVTVQLRDQSGNPIPTGPTVAVTLSSSPAGLNGTLTVNTVSGIASFSDLVFNTPGTYKITATPGGITGVASVTSTNVVVSAGAPTQVVITAAPSSGHTGTALSTLTAKIEDALGNVVTTSSAAITVSSTPTGVGGTVSVNAVSGVAMFNNLVFSASGSSDTLTASSTGLTSATTNPFVVIGPPSKLGFATMPPTGTAGAALSSLTVQIQDDSGNLISTGTGSVTLSSSPTGVSGTLAANAASGIATFNNVVFNTSGGYTLTATSSGLAAGTSGTVSIAAGAPNKLMMTTAPSSGIAGTALGTVSVSIQDSFGNVVTGSNAPVTITSSPSGVSGTLTVNAADGVATFGNLMFSTSGSYTVTASSGALATTSSGSIAITGGPQTITFGPLSGITFGASPFALSATATSTLTVQFASTTPAVCGVSATTVTIVGGGNCSITATQPGNGTWLAAPAVVQSFTVSPAAQTISFSGLPDLVYGASPFALTASASSGLAVTFTSNTPGDCSVSATTAAILAGGSCSIMASQTGNASWLPATPVTQTFNVAKANPVITWAQPADIIFGSALGAGQLNAAANVAGTFVYSPASGTVLPVGNSQTLSVTFTPANPAGYGSASASTAINVNGSAAPPSSPANLSVTRVLTRTGGNIVVQLTVSNSGGTAATGVSLTSVKVGTATATPLPQSLGTIAPGSSVTATVSVPGSVGASGAASTLAITATSSAGTLNSSARITLP